ncbi:class II aldolase/adducin family protein [Pandoraea pnomenusa]|uniref:class II aldolase/adducin family protein n=1 Tax=Pandoraea pnomenusa TaxID=93220 RepID=UPI0011984869|nr:class II aldolase/adducin family protein [Pandoraea pnomenusa]QDX22792.1 class II aldolase/adducin family protein [Pandoraea pnomenusa]
MAAVLPVDAQALGRSTSAPARSASSLATTPTGLTLNTAPQQRFWFDPPPERADVSAERHHRQTRLAAAFRLFARHGFDLGLAGHITARDPELTDHFWVNPLGVHFSRIRVSDLLLVNAKGETVVGNRPLNKAAFAIHAAIHEAHPHLVAAAHTHSTYGKAWSALGRKLDALTQDACGFFEDHALFDDFTGMVVDDSEGNRIASALNKPDRSGTVKGVILRNHGILTAGPTVEAAAWWYIALENAAHTQLLAEAAGSPIPIDDATARYTHSQVGGPEGALHAFESLYEGLVAAEPDLLD